MSAEGPLPRNGDTGATTEEVELAQVLESYLAHLEAGQPADPEGLIAAHPELARPLRACLKVMHLAQGLHESGELPAGTLPVDPDDSGTVPPSGSSALTALWPGDGRPPRVLLPEPPEDDSPVVRTHSDAQVASLGGAAGRYQVLGEVARGGMGVVLKARDADLGRDLALKVLLDRHRGDQDMVRRFVEEAQIGGQLQHPGIVPVHELGTLADLRPFFAMTLVKGRTLAALLAERTERAGRGSPDPALDRAGRGSPDRAPGPTHAGRGSPDRAPGPTAGLPPSYDDLPRFLGIFEAVCQTMAYAHARRVIHRDLKPANVMVGNFGEVQVMDWGLAKVLADGGIADEAKAMEKAETAILTVRSGSAASGSESQAGSVLGTPAYMAPEQARGDVERIDERADVFGLGAILCEILTRRPPYVGSTREEIRDKAARGDLAGALGRLAACGADGELIDLVRDCLATKPEHRPRSAGEVSRRLTAYLAGVQDRLKAAELARVEAQARAEEAQARARIERSRRLRTMALAASVLMSAGLAGGGWAYLAHQSQERSARVMLALGEVEVLRMEAERAGDDLARWHTARDAAHATERLLADAPDEPTRRRATALVRDVTQAAAAAENDQKLLASLVDIRSAKGDDPDGSTTDAAYEDAFRDASIDIAALSPAEAGAKIEARPPSVRMALAAALDDWAAVRRGLRGDQAGALRLTEASRLADPDPWRNRLRELLQTSSRSERLTSLKELAKSARFQELPAVSLHLLGATMFNMGDPTGAGAVLREGQRLYAGDVWLNFALAQCLERLARREEAIRYYMAARSLRPESAHQLAHALEAKGETDQAIALFQDLARLQPKEGRHLGCLGAALQGRGRSQEAKAVLEAAIDASRAAIRLKPGRSESHFALGLALGNQGKLDEAIAEFREALRLKPDFPAAHSNIGAVLYEQGKLDAAIAAYREALRLKSDFLDAHFNLGIALKNEGKLEEAIAEYREALRLKPDHPGAHGNLGIAFWEQGKPDEAFAEAREELRLNPDSPYAHSILGVFLRDQRKLDEAIAEYRIALRLKPAYPDAHNNFGTVLSRQGKLEEALAEFREALRLKPNDLEAHGNLGNALADQGKLDEAIVEVREALRLKPDDPRTHANLGTVLAKQGKFGEAIAEFREAVRLKPDYSEIHANLGSALAGQGKLDEAIAEHREAIRLKPDLPGAHFNLGNALKEQGKLDEAIAEYRTALRVKPDQLDAYFNLGLSLRLQGEFAQAISEFRMARELGKGNPKFVQEVQHELAATEQQASLAARLPAVLTGKLKPADAAETLDFALVCHEKKLFGASARLWAEAFQAQPKLAGDMQSQNRYNAACAAALAGCGQGKDDPPLDDAIKTRWRKQAIDWLKADLAAWSKLMNSAPPQARQSISRTLDHWKADTDLTGLRDPAPMATVTADEQKACRAVWAEVDALLAKARAGTAK